MVMAQIAAELGGFPFLEWNLNEGVVERRLRLSITRLCSATNGRSKHNYESRLAAR